MLLSRGNRDTGIHDRHPGRLNKYRDRAGRSHVEARSWISALTKAGSIPAQLTDGEHPRKHTKRHERTKRAEPVTANPQQP